MGFASSRRRSRTVQSVASAQNLRITPIQHTYSNYEADGRSACRGAGARHIIDVPVGTSPPFSRGYERPPPFRKGSAGTGSRPLSMP